MTDIHVDVADAGDLWARKDELAAREWEARRYWAQLRDDERAGIGLLVHDALLKLLTEQDTWLPGSCQPAGRRIDIAVSVILGDVDRAAMRARVRVERERVQRGSILMQLERALRGRRPE